MAKSGMRWIRFELQHGYPFDDNRAGSVTTFDDAIDLVVRR
jgi:hypothetical protein